MKSRTPTQRRSQPQEQTRLRAVPAPAQLSGGDGPQLVAVEPATSAAEFSESVRIVLSVARRAELETPVFRSPPRAPEVDRTIQRRGTATVIAIRRGTRPLAAIRADIIEGVVVANYLDPEQANEFRRLSWSALEAGVAVSRVSRDGGSAGSGGISDVVSSISDAPVGDPVRDERLEAEPPNRHAA